MRKSARRGGVNLGTGGVLLLLWAAGCGGPGAKIETPSEPAPRPIAVAEPAAPPPEPATDPVAAVPVSTGSSAEPEPSAKAAPPPYDVPARTTEELGADLVLACQRAKQAGKPVLLEFGAAWCKDCRRLGGLARVEPLSAELTSWERVEVNITDPEPHEALLQAFGVRAIAHWEALIPTKCDAPAGRWRRIGSRSVEPKRSDTATAEQLAEWLQSARKRAGSSK